MKTVIINCFEGVHRRLSQPNVCFRGCVYVRTVDYTRPFFFSTKTIQIRQLAVSSATQLSSRYTSLQAA